MRAVPRISVVVPIYNVEAYLAECLASLRAQTVGDFEALLVDDGSTDGSAAIARELAARDARFRLLSQPNAGLSAARNTGIDAASGEFLAFLDSDDLLPPNAYELLLGALDQTGSDFASGNVQRLTTWGLSQAQFLAEAFEQTRLGTHVTRFPALLRDRTAWNKLWRRSFWDAQGMRFPEGVVHEDIPIVLPAHFKARSVDVIADPVYHYRAREGGERSITQRRLERSVLLDRLAAVEHVSAFLAEHGPAEARRWYHERVLADDLRYHLDVLDRADDDYRALFLDRAGAFLAAAAPGALEALPAPERRKWELVRRREIDELVELLRSQRRVTLRMRVARRVPVRYRRQLRRAVRALRAR
jgi:glycosyltransferase involved in cell wall biosynthesis